MNAQERNDLAKQNKILSERIKDLEKRLKAAANGTSENIAMYETVFRLSPLPKGIFRFSDSIILDVNVAFCEAIGYSYDELIGSTSAALNVNIRNDNHRRFRDSLSQLRPCKNIEREYRRKDGGIIIVLQSAELGFFRGERAIISVYHDITVLKRLERELRLKNEALIEANDELNATVLKLERANEEINLTHEELRLSLDEVHANEFKYRMLFDAFPVGVVIADMEGNVITANPAIREMIGYSAKETVVLNLKDICEDFAEWTCMLDTLGASGRISNFEACLRRKDGSTFIALMNVEVIESDGNKITLGTVRDITEYRQSEQALRESEERFRLFFEASFEALAIHDKGTLLDYNLAMAKMFGYDSHELAGKDILELAAPGSRELLMKNILSGYEKSYELLGLRKDGTNIWGEIYSKAIPYKSRVARVTALRDITERKKIEEALRESEERYRNIVEFAPYGIIGHANGRIVYINAEALRLIGYERAEELIGTPVLNILHPDARDMAVLRIAEMIKTGKPAPALEEKFINKNGDVLVLEVVSTPIRIEGKDAFLAFGRDVTDRKRAEDALRDEKERLAVTLRSIGDGVITTDARGIILLLNAVAEELTGWNNEEAAGRPITEVFRILNEFTRGRCENPVECVLEEGRIAGSASCTILISRDGTERIVDNSGSPIRDKKNNAVGVVLVFRDITERRKMELEVQRAQRLETIGLLAGGIAHDFNNILTAIIGNISLAQSHVSGDENLLSMLNMAEKASFQAKELAQQLLTFSKGGTPVKKVSAVSELIVDSAGFVLRGSTVRCEFDIANDIRAADVDPGQISQVLQNVIINAEQAMLQGGVIKVSAENAVIDAHSGLSLGPGHYIKITIIDNGTGIPPEILPKIFDPYFTTKKIGTGLGLSIVYSIIKKHSGLIDVQSSVGEGTAVTIYLPASMELAAEKAAGRSVNRVNGGRLLLMDDERIVSDIAEKLLSALGYNVVVARDGREAINRYAEEYGAGRPFDLVILDLTVPGGMGGKECVSELLRRFPGVKALVSSGYSHDPVMSEYKSYGFQGVIFKPYRLEDLQEVLYSVIGPE